MRKEKKMKKFRVLIRGTKERLVFNVDTGALPPSKAENYVKDLAEKYGNTIDGEKYYFAKNNASVGTTVTTMGNLTEFIIEADHIEGTDDSCYEFVSFKIVNEDGNRYSIAKISKRDLVAIINIKEDEEECK